MNMCGNQKKKGMWIMAKNDDKLKALLEQAEQGTKDVFESDRYRN